ncbi:hypothetical protein QFC19_000750 [Naganishia cerealis]|uniref:Uncharacterized protein n=1 Tax=Naganishia cerealis TaxID=610337 RepID=A0ACC2WKT6_9TREE|nr:hypothetical protein QFC19_000750 [Naganishia cerealis]
MRRMSRVPVLPCPAATAVRFAPAPGPGHPLEAPRIAHIDQTTAQHLRSAAHHLHASRLVAFPTETVYGLGANTLDPVATAKVYALKGRPADNPLIVHVSSLRMLRSLIPQENGQQQHLSDLYLALIDAFWPGPLTLLFPARNPVRPPPAPQTIGIRFPAHPLARALITLADLPVSAPSANSSGRPSPTTAAHVFADLGRKGAEPVLGPSGEVVDPVGMLGCILDAGPCDVGVESTVVDGTSWGREPGQQRLLKVLRPGGIGVEQIEHIVHALDDTLGFHQPDQRTKVWVYGRDPPDDIPAREAIHSPRPRPLHQPAPPGVAAGPEIHNPSTPGMKYKHYSPSIPVYLLYPTNTFPSDPLTHTTTGDNTHPAHPDDEGQAIEPDSVIRSIVGQLIATRSRRKHSSPQSATTRTAPSSGRKTIKFGLMAFDDSPLLRAFRGGPSPSPGGAIPTPVPADAVTRSTVILDDGETAVDVVTTVKSLGRTSEDAARALFRDMLAFEGAGPGGGAVDGSAITSTEEGEVAWRTDTEHDVEPSAGSEDILLPPLGGQADVGVDAILIEACLPTGVGLAVMERVNKAVGGAGTGRELVTGSAASPGAVQKRFWVHVRG